MTDSNKFSCIRYCGRNWTLEDLQQTYDFVTVYNPQDSYPKDRFQTTFGQNPPAYYNYHLFVTDSQKFVVAVLSLSETDCTALAEYCKCHYHQYAWYNPVKFCVCKCCCGCLSAGPDFAQESVIKNAVKAYNYVHEQPFVFTR